MDKSFYQVLGGTNLWWNQDQDINLSHSLEIQVNLQRHLSTIAKWPVQIFYDNNVQYNTIEYFWKTNLTQTWHFLL